MTKLTMCRFYSQNIALQLLKILFFLENMQCNVIGLNCRFLAHDLLNKLGLSMENSHNREESCHNVKIVPEIIRYGSTLTGLHWWERGHQLIWCMQLKPLKTGIDLTCVPINCQTLSSAGLLLAGAGSCPVNRDWFLWLSNQIGLDVENTIFQKQMSV